MGESIEQTYGSLRAFLDTQKAAQYCHAFFMMFVMLNNSLSSLCHHNPFSSIQFLSLSLFLEAYSFLPGTGFLKRTSVGPTSGLSLLYSAISSTEGVAMGGGVVCRNAGFCEGSDM